MRIFDNGKAVPLLVERDAFEGVRRIAWKVAGDIKLVSGTEPLVLSEGGKEIRELILFATVGRSNLLEELESRGRIQTKLRKDGLRPSSEAVLRRNRRRN